MSLKLFNEYTLIRRKLFEEVDVLNVNRVKWYKFLILHLVAKVEELFAVTLTINSDLSVFIIKS